MAANNDTKFVLGDPNSSTPQVYSFDNLTLNSNADLVINGPVILNVRTASTSTQEV